MKKLLAITMMGLLIISTLSGCTRKGTADTFKRFETQEGGFQVLFPDKPKREIQTVESGEGYVEMIAYHVEREEIAYVVMYNDISKDVEKNGLQDRVLDFARDAMLKAPSLKIVKESKITLGKYPGREIVIEDTNGKTIIHDRLYIINNRLYQVMAETKAGNNENLEKDIQKFFNSFITISN